MRVLGVLCVLVLVACGGSHPTGASEVPTVGPTYTQLQAPVKLKGEWSTASAAPDVPGDHNVVVITPSYAKDDPESVSFRLADRRLPAIVYAGHIYENDPSTWGAAWVTFEAYLKPFKDRGVLVGIQPLDEPAHHGKAGVVAVAIADVRARGYRVLLTEVIDYIDESGFAGWRVSYPRVDWFHVTCYPYPQTRWNLNTCAQEYLEHPEWDAAILDTSWSNADAWVSMVQGKGRGWLLWRE